MSTEPTALTVIRYGLSQLVRPLSTGDNCRERQSHRYSDESHLQALSVESSSPGGVACHLEPDDAADTQQHPHRDHCRRPGSHSDQPGDWNQEGGPGRGRDGRKHDRTGEAADGFCEHSSRPGSRAEPGRCDAISWAAVRALRHSHQMHRGGGVPTRPAPGRGRPSGGPAGRAGEGGRADPDGRLHGRGEASSDRRPGSGAGRKPDPGGDRRPQAGRAQAAGARGGGSRGELDRAGPSPG